MRRIILFLLSLAALQMCTQTSAGSDFEKLFNKKTMRVDYFHSGTATEEHFSIDRIISDGEWGGSLNIMLDDMNLGPYFFEIFDLQTGELIYSRGFANIFGEWQTIPEAKEGWGTFHESIRFPWPKATVKLVMKKRNNKNEFESIWETEIDPSSRAVNPADLIQDYNVYTYLENGPATEKVDIVILGDGYSEEEMDKYHKDVDRLMDTFFESEPFKSRRSDFNVRAVETPAPASGVNKPHPGVFKRTPLSVSYSSFDSERYALAYDNRIIRDVASMVPYEYTIILINEETYGGGGIFRLYATTAVDNSFSEYIIIHEFGHHFAALGDEYYTSAVSYEMGEITVEPWEVNVTALFDPENVKWKALVEEGTPIPTPWNKEKFDNHGMKIQKERNALRKSKAPESELEALFARQREEEIKMIKKMEYKDDVGAFEGSGYMQYGYYRPSIDCIMYTRNWNVFCPVCQKAMSDVIDLYTK